jgi:hypothetical protein
MSAYDHPEWAKNVSIDYTKVEFGNSYAQRVIDPDISSLFGTKLSELWDSGKYGFPGSLAASILRSDFETLKTKKYHILPKSDGTRYILHAFTNDNLDAIVDMFERTGCHHIISTSFIKKVFQGTILDGELVKNSGGQYEYQVFDCIASCGALMVDRPYSQRLTEAQRIISSCYRYSPNDPFIIRVKKPFTPQEAILCMVLEATDQDYPLNYPVDGLILVSENDPYRSGKDKSLFKYKHMKDHTVDFHAKVRTWICDLYIIDDKRRKCVQTFDLGPDDLERLGIDSPIFVDNSILECIWSNSKNRWEPRKQRFDKHIPNNLETLDLTCQNIRENITIKELMSFFDSESA